jgi:pyruvate dehydrogenase E1 component alpha subunit
MTEEFRAEVAAKADAVAKELRAGCIGLTDPEPLSVFDNVFTAPDPWIERQKSQYAAYLAGFVNEGQDK